MSGSRAGVVTTLLPIAVEHEEQRQVPDRGSEDPALISRAVAGDRDALESLLRAHFDRVYAICRRMMGNDADAADASQEAMIAIVRGLHRFDSRSRLSTWIYRLSVNASIDELRKRSRRSAVGLDEVPAGRLADVPLPDGAADRVDIDRALWELPVDARAAVVLRDLCGLDYEEIASVLEIPPGTVRSRISRGRASLAKRLGAPEGLP